MSQKYRNDWLVAAGRVIPCWRKRSRSKRTWGTATLAAIPLVLAMSNSVENASAAQVRPAVQTEAGVSLTVSLLEGQRRTFRLVAEIKGGRDNDPDLYCQPLTWGFGDGPALTVTPMCAPWTQDVMIRRRFDTRHAYEHAGTYNVTFSYGPLTAKQELRVE
jgi:hypothetical protein